MEKKYKYVAFLIVCLTLAACSENDELPYKSGQVGVWFNKDVTVSEVFDIMNGYDVNIFNLSVGYMNSTLPPNKIPYILNELKSKPYFGYYDLCAVTGFLEEEDDQVSVHVWCRDMTKSNQLDWLQTIEKLQLTKPDIGSTVTIKVEPGHEALWIHKLNKNQNIKAFLIRPNKNGSWR